jgi:hypothetical protein
MMDAAALQCGAETASTALPLPLGLEPIVVMPGTSLALDALMLALCAKMLLAAILCWKVFCEL